jgi:hypothetical protein
MIQRGHSARRPALLVLAAALLSGCSSSSGDTYRQYGQILGQAFRSTFSRTDVPRATVAAIPYASMGYRIDNGDQAVLVLATDNGGNQIWTSSTHVVIQTNAGRITRTVGLPHDLAGTVPQRGQELSPIAGALQAPFQSVRLEDFPDAGAYGVTVSCSAAARRQERIAVLGQGMITTRIDEACQTGSLNWRFVDSFWLDPKTGFVWRSLQHLSPEGEAVETQIFRPPG